MCNLQKLTKRKTVVIYKTVVKFDEDYYSLFAGTKIEIGKVKKQTSLIGDSLKHKLNYRFYESNDNFFNPNMVGKCSGFKNLSDAKILGYDTLPVLKIVLGGEIWIGNANKIDSDIPYDNIIYAGSEILSAVKWYSGKY